jgi:Ca2+-binding EF-hand superfamily protein
MADRDGDDRLSRKELDAYIDRQSDAIASRLMLSMADRGRALFERLDTDGDQTLTLRELRQVHERLARLDRDGDGRIAQDELPRQYRLGIGRGAARLRQAVVLKLQGPDTPDTLVRRGGPEWFERMDRNRDGDVSRREFLGSRAQFRQFDTDRDGLIDPREARGKP